MKFKNTLGVAVGSILAATTMGAFAQGQGAVEMEVFGKRYFTDSSRDLTDGNLLGGSIGYFLTDDVSLNLSYGEIHDMRSDNNTGNKDIKGNQFGLEAIKHFGTAGPGLRPYISGGFAHQSISNVPPRSGRDHSTFATIGTGLKYYFGEHFFARAGVDGVYNIDEGEAEWLAAVGLGLNFGGNANRPVAAVEPAPYVEPTPEPVAEPEPAPELVRVELDVKFDFDKSVVKQDSYGDIKNLADFMNQYPQTSTTVEGHTDSVGSDAYNQKLSERRANAVRNVLVNEYGVDSSRVSSVGYGESRPVADNATEEGRAINRRVEAEVEAQVR